MFDEVLDCPRSLLLDLRFQLRCGLTVRLAVGLAVRLPRLILLPGFLSIFCGSRDMAHYMHSLRKVREREDAIFWPTHGPPIKDPQPFVQSGIDHRTRREDQIRQCIRDGQTEIKDMVPIIYINAAPRLHKAAARSVLAHLIQMQDEGRVRCEGEATVESVFELLD